MSNDIKGFSGDESSWRNESWLKGMIENQDVFLKRFMHHHKLGEHAYPDLEEIYGEMILDIYNGIIKLYQMPIDKTMDTILRNLFINFSKKKEKNDKKMILMREEVINEK